MVKIVHAGGLYISQTRASAYTTETKTDLNVLT